MSDSWPTITAADACARLKHGARGLDVRSEGEFAQGRLPGFANVPVLNDERRHLVGLTYKQSGPDEAIRLGHRLVDPDRPALVRAWTDVLAPATPPERLVLCWRGGLRSGTAAAWLAEDGVEGRRVEGGYKAVRGALMAGLERPPPALVLSGLTGAGKTDVLVQIAGALDLEGLARHRGSAFGRGIDEAQPAQATFENAVAFALYGRTHEFLVEDEGTLVGRNVVPPPVHQRVVGSPVVILEVSLDERVRQTFHEYVAEPSRRFGSARTREHLLASLNAVRARLGGLRAGEIAASLDHAFAQGPDAPSIADHETWIARLLTEYYDPMYEYGVKRHARPVEFRGARGAVLEFLRDRFRFGSGD